jgi:hypothetical protein
LLNCVDGRRQGARNLQGKAGTALRGHMIWFNAAKGFGFIRTEEDERLYIAESGFADGHVPVGRCAGIEMIFEREPADVEGGHQAVAAMPVEDSPQRRARSRRRGMG